MMKKIVLLLVIGLILTIPDGTIFNMQIKANVHSCGVEQFGLSNISQNKTWTSLGCFSSLSHANEAMANHEANYNDLVITHQASASPLKIVAASRAIAASYPFRKGNSTSNSRTVNIYRNSNLSGETTYMNYHLDMAYYETVSFDASNGTGSAKVQISGFVGYIPLLQIDIVPLIYVENNWDITLGGKTYLETEYGKTDQEQPFTLKPKMNEYRVSTNTSKGVRELYHQTFSFWSGNSYGTNVVGLAPDWMMNGTYYSWDGIHFYYDRAMTQPVLDGDKTGEYYNYYLYLPLRSTSNYSAADLDAYMNSKSFVNSSVMKNEGQAFVDAQNTYGMNALLVYALAIHESGHGLSSIAKAKNNLFGWGAFDSNPGDAYLFESISQSVSEHVGINLRGYVSIENWRYFGQAYGNKDNGLNTKYASDPYWGNKIAGHAYSIDRFNDFKDYGQYSIGILNKNGDISVKKEANNSASTLFTMDSTLNTQSVLLTNTFKEDTYTYYEVMSPMPVASGNIIRFNETSKEKVEYSWPQSKGYLVNESVHLAYDGTGFPNMPNVINQQMLLEPSQAGVKTLNIQDNKISLSGYHIQEGISVIALNQITHQLTLIDQDGVPINFPLTSTQDSDLTSLSNDTRYDLTNMGFSGVLDVKDVDVGVYSMQLESNATISNLPIVYSNLLQKEGVSHTFTTNGKTYSLFTNTSNSIVLSVNYESATTVSDTHVLVFDTLSSKKLIPSNVSENITFESSHPAIATVDAAGEVTAVASGITTILIKESGTIKSSVGVVVNVGLTGLTVNESSVSFTKLDQVKALVVSGEPATATHKEVTFASSNPTVASVNTEGLVIPKSNGKTSILIRSKVDPSITKTVFVNVQLALNSITANPNKLEFNYFETKRMILNASPSNAYVQSITYSSSNESVASVNSIGDIQPKSNGTTTITAKSSNGKTATLSVVVDIKGAPDVLLGDVNGDGKVSNIDFVILHQYLSGLEDLSKFNNVNSDMNQDSKISNLDFVLLHMKLSGIEN